jgi:glutathione S-transferase
MKIIGSYVSPYVRKVLACLALKDLAYEIDPITPFYGSEEFSRLSPLRRIPVLIDRDLTLCDSTVICSYLDEAYPGRPLLPAAPADRARARWFEEYADTRLGDLFIWGLFYQKIVHPIIWGEPGDQARIERTLDEDLPRELDYLERELPAEGWLFDGFGLADIALATFFRNGAYAGFEVDAVNGRERPPTSPRPRSFRLCRPTPFENTQRQTTPQRRREALVRNRRTLIEGDAGNPRGAPGRDGALRN